MNKRNNNTKRIEGKKSEAAATATITITTVAALNGEEEEKNTPRQNKDEPNVMCTMRFTSISVRSHKYYFLCAALPLYIN